MPRRLSIVNGTAPYSNPNGYQPLQPLANLNGSAGQRHLHAHDRRLMRPTTSAADQLVDHGQLGDDSFGVQTGAAMDQNADGTTDQNPISTPFTGLTPGDAYVVPTPRAGHARSPSSARSARWARPASSVRRSTRNAAADRARPESSPARRCPGAPARDNLITDGTTSTLNVTFDRPMQVSTFTPAQILQIMGPTGSITGPQVFAGRQRRSDDPGRDHRRRSVHSTSTLTVPNYDGTFTIGECHGQPRYPGCERRQLDRCLDRAQRTTKVTLFATSPGKNFTNTVFDDAAETSITNGTAPYTGTYPAAWQAVESDRPGRQRHLDAADHQYRPHDERRSRDLVAQHHAAYSRSRRSMKTTRPRPRPSSRSASRSSN